LKWLNKMNIFDILKNLYTNTSSKWIIGLDERDINPVVIQRFLSLNLKTQKKARLLNQFVFSVPPKMYLSAVWSLLFFNGKKMNKAPFIKYPKTKKEEQKYQKIHDKIRRQFDMSEKDLEVVRKFIDAEIEKDKPVWFAYYGMDNHYWLLHEADYSLIKEYNKRDIKKGLDAWM